MFICILLFSILEANQKIEVRGLKDEAKAKEIETKLSQIYEERDLSALTSLLTKYKLKQNIQLSSEDIRVFELQPYSDLYNAVIDNDIKRVREIIKKTNIDLDRVYIDRYTALITASYHGQDEIVKMLLEYGADVDKCVGKDRNNALGYAILEQHLSTIKLLVEAGANLEIHIGSGSITPLMYAVRKESVELVKYLLEKGANPNAQTKEGYTPLMFAIWAYPQKKGNAQIISLLLDRSDINHKAKTISKQGVLQTPLLDAIAMNRSQEFIDNLFAHGAKIADDSKEKVAFLKAYQQKAMILYRKKDIQNYIDTSFKAISYIGYSDDETVQYELGVTLSQAYEMLIIEGKTFDKKYREFFSKLSKENRSVAAYYDMFAILESATKKNQNEDIKIWQKKYKDNIPKWCFKDLKEWAKKLPYESQKRVLSYIKIFEINVC